MIRGNLRGNGYMKVSQRLVLILLVLLTSTLCLAEPTSGPVHIVTLRPYSNSGGSTGGAIYVTVDSSTFCSATVFKIDLTFGGAKEAYAAALSAIVSGKSVQLEVLNSTGCAGWGTTLQSIYILNQ